MSGPGALFRNNELGPGGAAALCEGFWFTPRLRLLCLS